LHKMSFSVTRRKEHSDGKKTHGEAGNKGEESYLGKLARLPPFLSVEDSKGQTSSSVVWDYLFKSRSILCLNICLLYLASVVN
jgi:hypothetical protein